MSFLRPDWLLFLAFAALLLPAAILLRRQIRRVDLSRFAGSRAVWAWSAFPGRLRFLSAALLLTLLALAGPEWGTALVEAPVKGIDLVAVVDASLSMSARDSQPDRLGLAKRELLDLAREFQGGRLGLVTFGGAGDLVCPLTHDRAGFASFVREVDPLLTPKGGPTRKDPHAVADALPPRTRESWLLLGEAMAGLSPSDVRFLLDLAGRLSLESTPERPELGHA